MFNSNSMSPADYAAISGSNDGWGGNGGAWWILILLVLFCGGFNGYGGFYGNGSGQGVMDQYALASDFSQLNQRLNSIGDMVSNGLCDGFYAQNTNLLNGFATVNQNVAASQAGLTNIMTQGFAGLNTAITAGNYDAVINGIQNTNALQAGIVDINNNIQNCCCQTKQALGDINYNIASQGNIVSTAIANSTRDIIDNQNANYRALHDEIVANRIEDKNAQIAAQQSQINALQLAASQQAQNAYLVDKLNPCKNPVPAYIVQNPNGCNCPYNNYYGFGYGTTFA